MRSRVAGIGTGASTPRVYTYTCVHEACRRYAIYALRLLASFLQEISRTTRERERGGKMKKKRKIGCERRAEDDGRDVRRRKRGFCLVSSFLPARRRGPLLCTFIIPRVCVCTEQSRGST